MFFIGDVHGEFVEYKNILDSLPKNSVSIQLGDMGLGFSKLFDKYYPENFPNAYFIRGNHDNPKKCSEYKNYLGDYGYNTNLGVFYISGAFSIDRAFRTEDIDWWKIEELSYFEFNKMIEMYKEIKPDVVISHDCPSIVYHHVVKGDFKNNSTSSALSCAFGEHQPKVWIFAHHHQNVEFVHKETQFYCVDSLNVLEIEF